MKVLCISNNVSSLLLCHRAKSTDRFLQNKRKSIETIYEICILVIHGYLVRHLILLSPSANKVQVMYAQHLQIYSQQLLMCTSQL